MPILVLQYYLWLSCAAVVVQRSFLEIQICVQRKGLASRDTMRKMTQNKRLNNSPARSNAEWQCKSDIYSRIELFIIFTVH